MIYIHVPFCKSFCVYCDFYSEIACGKEKAYEKDLLEEIKRREEQILGTAGTNTLYIGGGTPSVMPLPFFENVLKALPSGGFTEFTVEVNPDDIYKKGLDYVRGLKSLGVNRISMGVQSLDDKVLSWMGRRHDSLTAKRAYDILRDGGVENVSVDIIFGVGGQNMESLENTLRGILSWGPEHISAYQLSIEEGSALAGQIKEGKYKEASEQTCAEEYALLCSTLKSYGYEHYEISNWARPGYRAVHNSAYWERRPYVGLGPGAHSFMIEGSQQKRSWNSDSLTQWSSECEILCETEIREETIMLGLRRKEGVIIDGKHLSIPEDKWFIADSIIADLI